MGRRVRKEVYAWNNAARAYGPMPQTVRKFIYDDWNLVAELDVRDKLVRSYVWGPDLSGTLQGAGGIGGLLFINDGDSTYCPCYDGYGNITGLINADNGTVAAKYEYSPYGQVLISSGEYADSNPFQFSTKYTDTEVGLVYFGYRYYNPDMGRWINRDPIAEKGGENIYEYVRNSPIASIDLLGLYGGNNCSCADVEKGNCIAHCGRWKCWKAKNLADDLLEDTNKRFPPPNVDNEGDAWRHCTWACKMAREIGQDCAKIIGDQHEERGCCEGSQNAQQAAMDYHNNHTGRELAKQEGSCEDLCMKALANGDLIIIGPQNPSQPRQPLPNPLPACPKHKH